MKMRVFVFLVLSFQSLLLRAESLAGWQCDLEGFNNVISCTRRPSLALWDSCSKRINDCVGNANGQMVHGANAGDSCKDYSFDEESYQLSAKCRDNNGQLQSTSINIFDYFMVGSDTGRETASLGEVYDCRCAQ
ncbi:MAG: CVNH domain-containing protein [Chromatiaceae bacterium]|nr:CVNH domain-containing protein [Chromatiaceae bacterium]MCF7995245.1 CVNH domain-containing protein [Chromatiaceae bacterium]